MRGTGLDDMLDLRPCALGILDDLICPEAYDAPSLAFHHCRATRISLDLKRMMIAIDLDHELARYAGEVCEVGTDRVLTSELDAADAAISQEFPDLALGATSVATEFTCSIGVVVFSGHNPLT